MRMYIFYMSNNCPEYFLDHSQRVSTSPSMLRGSPSKFLHCGGKGDSGGWGGRGTGGGGMKGGGGTGPRGVRMKGCSSPPPWFLNVI